MIKHKIIKKEVREKIIDKASCSFCGKEFDETTIEFCGFGQMNFSFGYGSGFDDDNFSLEICDDCFLKRYYKLLKKQFKEKGWRKENIKKMEERIKNEN